MKIRALIVVATLITFSCAQQEVSVKELALWVRDPSHGFVDSVEAGPYVLSMQYLPSAFLNAVAASSHRKAEAQSGLAVFELSIRMSEPNASDPVFSGITDLDDFTRRMQTLAFTIENDVKVRIGARTLDCVSAAFQQDVGLRPVRSVRLVFHVSESELQSNKEVIIEWSDNEYATGKNLFRCDLSQLDDMPKVKS